jgi:predicted glycoside hydrolase/deacetylase ChbG (UPF0249 family)
VRVLVHADDLGLSDEVNDAIGASCARGWVRSVSALATAPAWEGALRSLPAHTDLGVHLDLTGFPALTGRPELASLRALALAGSPRFLPALDELAHTAPGVVVAEWHAQIERVRAHRAPSHVDSHQHLHWRPCLWPALRRVIDEAGIRDVRGVAAFRPNASAIRRVAQRARAAHFHHHFADVVRTDATVNPATLPWLLDHPQRGVDVVELVVHPGNPYDPAETAHADILEAAWSQGAPGWRLCDRHELRGPRRPSKNACAAP